MLEADKADSSHLNLLTTYDAFWHHLTLEVHYQLAQLVLKMVFVLTKRWEMCGHIQDISVHMTAALAAYRMTLVGIG